MADEEIEVCAVKVDVDTFDEELAYRVKRQRRLVRAARRFVERLAVLLPKSRAPIVHVKRLIADDGSELIQVEIGVRYRKRDGPLSVDALLLEAGGVFWDLFDCVDTGTHLAEQVRWSGFVEAQ